MKNNVNEERISPLLLTTIVRTMKITALFIVLGITSLMASNAYSQKARVTLNVDNASLELVLDEIENQSEFYFLFNQNRIDINRKVQIKAKNQKINKVLDELFVNTGVNYEVFDRQIVLTRVDVDNADEELNEASYYKNRLVDDKTVTNITNRNVEKSISGKLTDATDGTPLIGANILVKGTTIGTISDADGVYKLSVSDDATTLIFSYIGYETQEVEIGSRSVIDLAMTPDLKQLEEIIVVGYGSVKKSDLTGSVASVSAADLTAYPAVDAIQALQGRAAGVTVTATNGAPGSGYSIQIRGNTSINASSEPLIVVDGLVGGVMPPPEDIQSMEILKDASSTAIYGSRGANGVIMVTTKRGKSGTIKVNFSSSWSSQQEVNRLDLLNADQFTSYIQEIDPSYIPEITGTGTDWQDGIYQTGNIQNYQLSVSGGSDKVSYYVSGVAYDQKGVVKNSDFKRYSITSNVDIKATNNFRIGANIFARRTSREGSRTQEQGYFQPGTISSAIKMMPTQGIYDAFGDYSVSDRGDPMDNPVALVTELQDEGVADLVQGNTYAEIKILEGLNWRSTFGATLSNGRTGRYYPRTLERGGAADGEAWLGFSKNTDMLTEHYLSYDFNLGDAHQFTAIAGYSYQSFRTERINVQTTGYISDSFSFWNIGASTDPPLMSSSLITSNLSSWYGRINYSFRDKILLTFNARQDGSSRFAKNNKWAFFPSGAVAWNILNEDFLSDSKLFNALKLRVSYGKTGNQAIQPYQSLATFTNVLTTVQGSIIPAIRPANLANEDLTWESTTQTDVGVDFGLLDGRIDVTMDYYIMKTSDLLFNVPLPIYSGYTTQLQNIGTVENKGFEFTVNAKILTGGLKWNTNGNISFNNNEITDLIENDLEGNDILYSSWPLPGRVKTQLLREGQSTGTFWGYVYDGVLQSGEAPLVNGEDVGGESFKDLNGDGVLTDDDRTIIGNPHPNYIWGWSNDLSYKRFDLNIFFQGSQGGQMLNYSLMEIGLLNGRMNTTTEALNRWTTSNTDTDIPMASAARGYVASDRWIEDASYVRLKNISLGYNFPESLLSKIKLSSARIYISGQNLLTISDYKGLDPEVSYRSSNTNVGLDYGSYPNVKSYTLGLNIGF